MSDFPEPAPGQIIRYQYLWKQEAEAGEEEGAKARPAVIIVASPPVDGRRRVIVVPITHTRPTNPDDAIELPAATCRRVGLDDQPQWVVVAEVNAFNWPGPDLRPLAGKGPESVVIGHIPPSTFFRITARIEALRAARRVAVTQRTDIEGEQS